jgi:hypothetical protein
MQRGDYMAETLEVVLLMLKEFGPVVTFVLVLIISISTYALRMKTKQEKLLKDIIEQLSEQNKNSVDGTKESIQEIKQLSVALLENTKELTGEIRGIIDMIKYLMKNNIGE